MANRKNEKKQYSPKVKRAYRRLAKGLSNRLSPFGDVMEKATEHMDREETEIMNFACLALLTAAFLDFTKQMQARLQASADAKV